MGALAKPELGDAVGRKARDGTKGTVKPPESMVQAFVRRVNELLFIKGTTQLTSTGARRIDYLDGMRGFACFLVSFHHFMLIYYFGITTPNAPHHYPRFEFWFRSLIGPIVVNQGLKLGIFFMLPSRTMTNRYLLKGGLQSMADATVRRIPRLALPVAGAVLANYMLMDVGAFKWVPRLASRTWSTWSYWQNFDNVMVFLDAFISLWWSSPPVQPALVTGYATGVLWTIPVIVQGTWTCMICALIAHEIKNAYKRFSFYALCIGLSWYANTWDLFFMAGLVVADLDSKLNYQARAKKGFPIVPGFLRRALHLPEKVDKLRVHGQVFAWVLFLAAWTQQYLSQIPGSPGVGFDNKEFELHPDWSREQPHAWVENASISYTDPRVASWVLSFFVLPADGSVGSAARLLPAACVVVHRSPRVCRLPDARCGVVDVVGMAVPHHARRRRAVLGDDPGGVRDVVCDAHARRRVLHGNIRLLGRPHLQGRLARHLGWPGQEGLRLPYVLVSSTVSVVCCLSLSLSFVNSVASHRFRTI